jgi:hypothetical protein
MGGRVCVGGKCGCSTFTDCCVAAATCTAGVCGP